jgi:hypothetical protein
MQPQPHTPLVNKQRSVRMHCIACYDRDSSLHRLPRTVNCCVPSPTTYSPRPFASAISFMLSNTCAALYLHAYTHTQNHRHINICTHGNTCTYLCTHMQTHAYVYANKVRSGGIVNATPSRINICNTSSFRCQRHQPRYEPVHVYE